jgi:CubicO group peptidase (beta-lactamase class C family)
MMAVCAAGAFAVTDIQKPSRRTVAKLALALPALALTRRAGLADGIVPGADWERAAPKDLGFAAARFDDVEAKLFTMPTTALMVVASGRVIYSYGDNAQACYLASARKSILSMLYGKYVLNGTIRLDDTMADLGIDEDDGLLPVEMTARVRDLLIASSGVYHAAANPGDDPNAPARGSKQPGAHFHYNNWDFNVLGGVFEKLTGKTIFNALAQDLAAPLGMQDFELKRQRMLGYQKSSRFLAYHMFLSGRDMARLGLVMARGGSWNGKEIVPPEWVSASTRPRVDASAVGRGGEFAYGYLWWVPVTRIGPEWKGAYFMSGNFGQYVLVLPAIDTVIVHRRAVTDEYVMARNLGTTRYEPVRVTASDFMRVADMIVAARVG